MLVVILIVFHAITKAQINVWLVQTRLKRAQEEYASFAETVRLKEMKYAIQEQ